MPSKVFGSSWCAHRHDRRSRFFAISAMEDASLLMTMLLNRACCANDCSATRAIRESNSDCWSTHPTLPGPGGSRARHPWSVIQHIAVAAERAQGQAYVWHRTDARAQGDQGVTSGHRDCSHPAAFEPHPVGFAGAE
jgi:hypothetical protein